MATEENGIGWDELSPEKQQAIAAIADEALEDEDGNSDVVSRRSVLQALGTLGVGAAVGAGAREAVVGDAAAATPDQIGTSSTPIDKLYSQSVNAGSLNSIGWVDASSDTDADLNSALSNNADGAILYGGILTITESIVIPAGKTLYFLNGSGLKVDGSIGIGGGGMNTQTSQDGSRTLDMMIDARGNDDAALIALGQRAILDANIDGTSDRAHFMFANADNCRVEGFETRGGRGGWMWDCTNSVIEDGYHNHANDPNNQQAATVIAEGLEDCEIREIEAIGDSSSTPNIKEAVDLNARCWDTTVENIQTRDVVEGAVDATNCPGVTIRNVNHEGPASESAVRLTATDSPPTPQLSSKSAPTAIDHPTVKDVDAETASASSDFAVEAILDGDISFEAGTVEATARNMRAFLFSYSGSPVNQNANGWDVEVKSINAGARAVNKEQTVVETGWTVKANVRGAGGIGAALQNLGGANLDIVARNCSNEGVRIADASGWNGTITSIANADGIVVDNASDAALQVSITANSGTGISAINGSDNNHYDGRNADGVSGLGTNSVNDTV